MAANILVFGASTTYGAWDPEGGWVTRLRKWLDEKNIGEKRYKDYSGISLIYNLGISDETTRDLIKRFKSDTEPRLWENNIFIFFAGLNDASFNNQTNSLITSPEEFQDNLKQLTELAKEYSQKIIFVGSLPVDETKTDPVPWLKERSYTNEYVGKYNEIAKNFCQEQGVYFVEIYHKVIHTDYQKLLEDGLHGNAQGHQLIFEEVKNFLVNGGWL